MANTKLPARLLDTSAIPALNVTGDLTVDTNTLKVDSTNNRVGIGTNSPQRLLHVFGQAQLENNLVLNENTPAIVIPNGDLRLFTGGSEKMRLDSSGNVGIGTAANIDQILHLEKSSGTTLVKTEVAANSIVGFEIQKTGSTTSNWRIVDGQTVNGNLEIYDVTDSRSVMIIDGDGDIGMGVAPATHAKLTLGGTAASYSSVLAFDNNTAGGATFFMLASDNTWSAGANKFLMGHGSPSSSAVDVTIDADGNVGIGTSSPSSWTKLQINAAAGAAQTGAAQQLNINAPTTTAGHGAGIRLSAASGSNEAVGIIGMVNNASGNAGSMTFHTYNLGSNIPEVMRIDNTGRVGINRVPSIANSKLEVGGADNVPLINVEASGNTAGIGIGGSQMKLYYSNSHIGGFSIGNTNKYNGGSSPGLGGSGGNLRLEGDDSQIIMANNFIHSDNSGNTKFTIRAAYGAVSSAAELALDGGFVSMNVGSSYLEMLKATTGNVTIGRTGNTGYYLKVITQYGYGEQGAQNSSYYHNSTDRPYNYWGQACYASGGFHTYSDETLKKEITTITGALDSVAKMNGVTFKWKDPETRGGNSATGKQFGIIAQNMLEVDSELPILNDDPLETQENIDDSNKDTSYYSMDYSRLTPYFIEAIKELKTKNEALEARIATLEG